MHLITVILTLIFHLYIRNKSVDFDRLKRLAKPREKPSLQKKRRKKLRNGYSQMPKNISLISELNTKSETKTILLNSAKASKYIYYFWLLTYCFT